MTTTDRDIRAGIIGCGRIAGVHVRHLRTVPGVRIVGVCDLDSERARQVAEQAGGAEVFPGPTELLTQPLDAVHVLTPPTSHADVAIAALERGVHVLVEKPMAMTPAECDEMLAAAERSGAVLAVGMVSRFFAVGPLVRSLVGSGVLGELRSFRVREGFVYDWPVASDFMFRKEAGGGVLADTGAHVLDQLSWWLGGAEVAGYRDDAEGGVEADCEVVLRAPGGAEGTVELSRTRALGNDWRLVGERGELRTQRRFDAPLSLRLEGAPMALDGTLLDGSGAREQPIACFERQLADFVGAVREGRAPAVDGREGRRAVDLIAACRAVREPLAFPWEAV